jgi:hypothetical protein
MNKLLFESYQKILTDIDVRLINPESEKSTEYSNLSGMFLPSVSDDYVESKNKIMIVGRETKGWGVLGKEERFSTIDNYIQSSMKKHKRFFADQLTKKDSRGCSFHNFTRSVANKCGNDGIIYSNLFCFSFKKSIPTECSFFPKIKKLSEKIIKAQIEILKPTIIIFANGVSSADFRREIFPVDGEGSVCSNFQKFTDDDIKIKHLWSFELYNKIKCYRVVHPSAFSKDAIKSRDYLINLLPSKICGI